MSSAFDFKGAFRQLTGKSPFDWQTRLFEEFFAQGRVPQSVDVPTGLGKTSVMALWLLARSQGAKLPRRLVYVVDRRAVVDQATAFAGTIRDALEHQPALKAGLGLEEDLPISTLRGQFADNREWLEDPSSPAIVVGTVDMVGSRLLFEGYGVSRKTRAYHAGFLGADCLIVLDESHLVPSFEELLNSIETGTEQFAAAGETERNIVPSFHLMSLSATGKERASALFRLEKCDYRDDPIVRQRLSAKKALSFWESPAAPETALVESVWGLTNQGSEPARCVVFCNDRETAQKVHDQLIKKAGKENVEMLVGARRIYERQEVSRRLEGLGYFSTPTPRPQKLAFLVATSAGEVGIDLDSEHMACDLVSWERMIQRLGRVNRLGNNSARVEVLLPKPDPKQPEKQKRLDAVFKLLGELPSLADGLLDASPGALRDLKCRPELQDALDEATTPAPLRPALERAHLDAWSLTSLSVENPGRPDIAPWLRGWVEELPQTVVVWRKYLPIRHGESGLFKPRYRNELNKFFEAAPLHLTEQLETETHHVVDWLFNRAALATNVIEANEIVAYVLNNASEIYSAPVTKPGERKRDYLRLSDFTESDKETKKILKEQIKSWLAGRTLVVDSRLGGLSHGLLEKSESTEASCADDGVAQLDNTKWEQLVGFRLRRSDSPESSGNEEWPERYRFVTRREQNGNPIEWLVVEKYLAISSNEDDRSAGFEQELEEHQAWAEDIACKLGASLRLPQEYQAMLALAARLHDEGKRAENWQRAFRSPDHKKVYAKTKGPINFELLAGYRHEFGSLPKAEPALREKFSEDVVDLALHLIAAHHGQARPTIRTDGCPDAPPSALTERALQVSLRFARMQERWGPWGLAWWESLLRAVDQKASKRGAKPREAALHG